jgi:hypothetical protein
MKNFYYLVTGIALMLVTIIACEQDSMEFEESQVIQEEGVLAKKADKATICHYDSETDTWITINISMNALEAHKKHGDKYDWDGDGFYPENECGIGEDAGYDCDDTDALVNPSADEICGDGIDNNCNGEIDENCDDPCLDEAINQVSVLIEGLGGTDLSTTITSSNTFIISWFNGRDGRGCIETTAEATGAPETGCGYTNLHHENVPCS